MFVEALLQGLGMRGLSGWLLLLIWCEVILPRFSYMDDETHSRVKHAVSRPRFQSHFEPRMWLTQFTDEKNLSCGGAWDGGMPGHFHEDVLYMLRGTVIGWSSMITVDHDAWWSGVQWSEWLFREHAWALHPSMTMKTAPSSRASPSRSLDLKLKIGCNSLKRPAPSRTSSNDFLASDL